MFRLPVSQKSVVCSWVVNFFALNSLTSRRNCLLVFGVGLWVSGSHCQFLYLLEFFQG